MTMMNPTHPGESVRNCIEESGLTVTECAQAAWRDPEQPVKVVERADWDFGFGGPGVGTHRLEQRGVLDEIARKLRIGARAAKANGGLIGADQPKEGNMDGQDT